MCGKFHTPTKSVNLFFCGTFHNIFKLGTPYLFLHRYQWKKFPKPLHFTLRFAELITRFGHHRQIDRHIQMSVLMFECQYLNECSVQTLACSNISGRSLNRHCQQIGMIIRSRFSMNLCDLFTDDFFQKFAVFKMLICFTWSGQKVVIL